MKPGSILEAVARHEQALVAKLEAAQREAEQIVADARSQAVRMREESRQKTEHETTEMRLQAEAAREQWREALRREAAEELERRRAEAQSRAPQVVEDVMALVLPRMPEGGR
jgi:V/A-type H+-transporting ATPase subunit G/H